VENAHRSRPYPEGSRDSTPVTRTTNVFVPVQVTRVGETVLYIGRVSIATVKPVASLLTIGSA